MSIVILCTQGLDGADNEKEDNGLHCEMLYSSVVIIVDLILCPNRLEAFDLKTDLITSKRSFLQLPVILVITVPHRNVYSNSFYSYFTLLLTAHCRHQSDDVVDIISSVSSTDIFQSFAHVMVVSDSRLPEPLRSLKNL